MKRETGARISLTTTWLILSALTAISVLLAERLDWHATAIVAMFGIAGLKSELVIANYMEIGRALAHWRVAYRCWLVIVATILTIAHLIT